MTSDEEIWPYWVLVCGSATSRCEQIGIMRFNRLKFAKEAARAISREMAKTCMVMDTKSREIDRYKYGERILPPVAASRAGA